MRVTGCLEQNKIMPLKTIFTKYPLLSVPYSFLGCGLIRTEDQNILKLYIKMQDLLESPIVWEGTFRLAALLKPDPIHEPVTERILNSLAENDNGSFRGSIEEQIAIARAAIALFEFNTDRLVLKRIASWCRYLEIEWHHLFVNGRTIFCPADLMEMLVRFYQLSGIRSVLRLCTRLRSAAFDWTTSLHTIRQIIPLGFTDPKQISFIENVRAEQIDYNQKQVLLNHAVLLADGIRYSLYAGVFSGNRQDLTAGKTAWEYLQKRFRAICGGTTSSPFLNGAASNSPVSTEALAAWTEALSAQMLLPGSEWAVDELIRIVFNGLSFCLKERTLPEYQYVNSIARPADENASIEVYARISRAVAAAYSHGITVTESGIRINYLLESQYILMIHRQPVILQSDGQQICFRLKGVLAIPVEIFRSETETADICLVSGKEKFVLSSGENEGKKGYYIHTEKTWSSQDMICYNQEETVIDESTHHQGICWFVRNRLMVFTFRNSDFRVAASEIPVFENNRLIGRLYRIDGWHLHHDRPDDIPVLPEYSTGPETVDLIPYDSAVNRISMIPRVNPLCLK